MGLNSVPNHQAMWEQEVGLKQPSTLLKGLRLVNEAQLKLNELRDTHSAQMKAAGYTYVAYGSYDCECAVWVHSDYLIAANKQLDTLSCLMYDELARDMGLKELPEGAIINVIY